MNNKFYCLQCRREFDISIDGDARDTLCGKCLKPKDISYSRKEKAIIKSFWPHMKSFKFPSDGTVLAQRHIGGAYGLLLTKERERDLLDTLEEE